MPLLFKHPIFHPAYSARLLISYNLYRNFLRLDFKEVLFTIGLGFAVFQTYLANIMEEILKILKLNRTVMTLLLLSFPAIALAHGISETDKAALLSGGYLRYLWLGASHMLTGYDHLLFIFGVIFFLTGFRDILKYITIFTVGHSLTLIFATIFSITANYYLVDAVIALSVCYKGFDNLDGFKRYFKMPSPNLLWVIFIFGLIHGFGLSTRLQQLPLGESGLILRILSFNVGVELGQITALTIMLALIISWRRFNSFKQFSTVSNAGLIVAGAFLFLMQIHGYGHTTDPDSFGFSTDKHFHEHKQMEGKIIEVQKNSHDSIF